MSEVPQPATRTKQRRVGGILLLLVALGAGWFLAAARFRMGLPEAIDKASRLRDTAVILAHFPDADAYISYFTAQAGPPTWNATLQTDRIEINAQARIHVNRLGHTVSLAEPVRVTIACIDRIVRDDDRIVSIEYEGAGWQGHIQMLRDSLGIREFEPIPLDALADFVCRE